MTWFPRLWVEDGNNSAHLADFRRVNEKIATEHVVKSVLSKGSVSVRYHDYEVLYPSLPLLFGGRAMDLNSENPGLSSGSNNQWLPNSRQMTASLNPFPCLKTRDNNVHPLPWWLKVRMKALWEKKKENYNRQMKNQVVIVLKYLFNLCMCAKSLQS